MAIEVTTNLVIMEKLLMGNLITIPLTLVAITLPEHQHKQPPWMEMDPPIPPHQVNNTNYSPIGK